MSIQEKKKTGKAKEEKPAKDKADTETAEAEEKEK